jgi:MoaD family protein
MRIRVRFWSYFKDLTGQTESLVELGGKATLEDLWNEVSQKFPKLEPMRRSVLMAVGVEYRTSEYELKAGDEVSFFPPVQGG